MIFKDYSFIIRHLSYITSHHITLRNITSHIAHSNNVGFRENSPLVRAAGNIAPTQGGSAGAADRGTTASKKQRQRCNQHLCSRPVSRRSSRDVVVVRKQQNNHKQRRRHESSRTSEIGVRVHDPPKRYRRTTQVAENGCGRRKPALAQGNESTCRGPGGPCASRVGPQSKLVRVLVPVMVADVSDE